MNNNGKTPLELIGDFGGLTPLKRKVIERARLLLSRAPENRAWRRRCWLVMVHSRALNDTHVIGVGDEGEGLEAVVGSLVGLGLEGVFRTVVGFL